LPIDLISRIQARHLEECRYKGLEDGEIESGWDAERDFHPESDGWAEKVMSTIPNVEQDEMFLLRKLERDIQELKTDGTGPSDHA
jgi:hypothetical protein